MCADEKVTPVPRSGGGFQNVELGVQNEKHGYVGEKNRYIGEEQAQVDDILKHADHEIGLKLYMQSGEVDWTPEDAKRVYASLFRADLYPANRDDPLQITQDRLADLTRVLRDTRLVHPRQVWDQLWELVWDESQPAHHHGPIRKLSFTSRLGSVSPRWISS